MCLTVDLIRTIEYKEELFSTKKKFHKCWKVFKYFESKDFEVKRFAEAMMLACDTLYSPVMRTEITTPVLVPKNVVDYELYNGKDFGEGCIHAHTSCLAAYNWCNKYEIVQECVFHRDDFIALGDNEDVVVKKLFIPHPAVL